MNIEKIERGPVLILRLAGRLEAHTGEGLSQELEAILHQGYRHLELDLETLDYLSSAGLRVLINYRRRFTELKGTFFISRVSEAAKKIIESAGMQELLTRAIREMEPSRSRELIQLPFAALEIYHLDGALSWETIGVPGLRDGRWPATGEFRSLAFPPDTFSLGIGCLGEAPPGGPQELGLFLAAGGFAAYRAANSESKPDFMEYAPGLSPQLQVLSGLLFRGNFSRLICFEARGTDIVPLHRLIPEVLQMEPGEALGMVMVAETRVIVGDSPRLLPGTAGSVEPGISLSIVWHPDCLALVAGVIARRTSKDLGGWLEPLGEEPSPKGYLHAEIFAYRPLPKGFALLPETVRGLFQQEVEDVFHVRLATGNRNSYETAVFNRGRIWLSPLNFSCGKIQ